MNTMMVMKFVRAITMTAMIKAIFMTMMSVWPWVRDDYDDGDEDCKDKF